jgi:hypothetical protein
MKDELLFMYDEMMDYHIHLLGEKTPYDKGEIRKLH